MELSSLKQKIYDMIINNDLLSGGNIIDYDTALKEYGLDSVGIVDLIVTIEEEYSFEFNAEDLNLENFESVNKISELVFRKLQ